MTSRSDDRCAVRRRARTGAIGPCEPMRRWVAGVSAWSLMMLGGLGLLVLTVAPELMAESRRAPFPGSSALVDDRGGTDAVVFVPVLMAVATLLAHRVATAGRWRRVGRRSCR
jgi:hypothetical protein